MNDTITPSARRALLQPNADKWLEAVPLAMLGVDSGLRIRTVNASAADLLGAAGRGLLGRRLSDVFGPDSPITDLCRRCLTQEMRLTEGDVALEGPGFSLRGDLWASPLDGQEFVSIVVVPRTRARAAGETTRPMSAVAKTLAHEVRNPLAGIRGAAQLIRKSTGPEEIEPLVGLIIDEVDRIRRLTDRIGALDGLAAPKFARVNVHEALERVYKIVTSTFPDVTLRERYDPSLPLVRADFDQLIQAFLNIAKNAGEAVRLRNDGEIIFSTAYRPGLRIRSALGGAPRAQLEIQIEDNGPGVSEATQARLFEPFVTTKMGGMGLGLAVSAEIIARHGGRIECESVPGRTIFKLLLPIDRQEDAT